MNEIGRVLFIVNKFAGKGNEPTLEKKIEQACESAGVSYGIVFTSHKGHATDLAKEGIENGFNRIIAVGGDGTVNEVAKGLLNTETPMGILPKGSGNGLARHLGIPINTEKALDALLKSGTQSIDTLKINDRLSVNVSGVGFDGLIANLFETTATRGLMGYVKLTLRELINFKDFDVEISCNGKVWSRKSFIMAFANSSQYGNNAKIAPAASVTDSLLQVAMIRKVSYFSIPGFVLNFFTGRIENSRFCEMLTTQSLTMKTAVPMSYHVDGEACGASQEFNISVHPSSLHMMVPESRLARI